MRTSRLGENNYGSCDSSSCRLQCCRDECQVRSSCCTYVAHGVCMYVCMLWMDACTHVCYACMYVPCLGKYWRIKILTYGANLNLLVGSI